MKPLKISFISIFFLFSHHHVIAQCATNDFFSISQGVTLFDATILLNSNANVSEVHRTLPFEYYQKPPYLNGDSVKISQIRYKLNSITCINGYKDSESELVFCDDHLFRMDISISFSRDDLSKCQSLYSQLLNSLQLQYKFKQEMEITGVNNEKIGQGWNLYKDQVARKQLQYETISINYTMEYYKDYEKKSLDLTEWGKVKAYVLEISYTNLFNTKLTSTQYY